MVEAVQAETSALELSDAEFMEQDPSIFMTDEVVDEKVDQEIDSKASTANIADGANDEVDPNAEAADAAKAAGSEAQEQADADATNEQVSQSAGDTQKKHENSGDSNDSESLDTSDTDKSDTKDDNPDTEKFDYKSAFEKVSEPFKANGVDMQVKDPEDIIKLMQMGANYQKKMGQMKPHLKMIKMLENNGLLDEDKLHNLIDLSKKDPTAIAKLIKESGIDPLDVDTAAKDYKPTNYSVSDKEFNLDQVLDDIKDTDTFSKTINVLTKEWDADSKSAISDTPEIIRIINTHMGNGVFDKVNTVLQQEKMLGKLAGVSDVDAYKQIAERLHKSGELREEAPDTSKADSDTSKVSSETDATSQASAERDKARKAVAPVKDTVTTSEKTDENFLGLSDDEFMKKYPTR